jgi:hypothetical protein
MSRDVIITPASGLIDFQNLGNSQAQISLTAGNNLVISNPGGDLSLGDTASNVFIGDGINSVDIIFEQSGAIRALAGKTLTLGQADSFVAVSTSLAVTGNVTSGNISGTTGAFTNVSGNGAALTAINASNIASGTLPAARLSGTYTITVSGAATSATTAGTVTTAAQPNITSVGTLTSLNVGAVTSTGLLTGRSSTNTDVNTANDGGSFSARGNASTVASMSFHRTSAYAINMGLGTDNVFRIGGWSAANNCMQLTGSGAMTILSSLTLNSAGGATAIVNGGTNGVGNIGASGTAFNTVFAKSTSAQYADLAEIYESDSVYEPGTVVIFGGSHEITVSTIDHDTRVAGVVSTNPAYIMNSEAAGLPVALTGRVPCLVQGPVEKGSVLAAGPEAGVAVKLDNTRYLPGCVIGKALERISTDEIKLIEVVVGRF